METKTNLSSIVHAFTADDLVTQGASASVAMVLTSFYWITVRCHYSAVNFQKNIHKWHPIARPLGRATGCLLWIQHLIDNLPQFLQSLMQNLTIVDRVIMALECTVFSAWGQLSTIIFIQENVSENVVCKMVTILFMPSCMKWWRQHVNEVIG